MTRLTNAYSKKKRSLDAAVSLHAFWYNFGRHHSAIRCTPAMAVGAARLNGMTLEALLSTPSADELPNRQAQPGLRRPVGQHLSCIEQLLPDAREGNEPRR
jgi:hypothetical protein